MLKNKEKIRFCSVWIYPYATALVFAGAVSEAN